jgi:hypothetical protein
MRVCVCVCMCMYVCTYVCLLSGGSDSDGEHTSPRYRDLMNQLTRANRQISTLQRLMTASGSRNKTVLPNHIRLVVYAVCLVSVCVRE